MAPSATEPSAQAPGQENTLPPPCLYPVREVHFEKYLKPQPDGYQLASRRSQGASIVIDNGKFRPPKSNN